MIAWYLRSGLAWWWYFCEGLVFGGDLGVFFWGENVGLGRLD